MIEPELDIEDIYPDSLVLEILAAQPSGRPGVSNFPSTERDVFVWCDEKRIPRGVLTIGPEAADRGWVAGDEFTIFVHPEWRRRGIATKLYHVAADFYYFELEMDPLHTKAGAAWANKLLEKAEQPEEMDED